MGYHLRRWLADRLPAGLSSGERLVALEIADQANERTRLAFGAGLLDIIVRRTGLANQKQVGKVLGKLAANGIELRVPVRGKDGEIIRNHAGRPLYAFEGHKLTFRVPAEEEFPARVVSPQGEHSTEARSPGRGSTDAERSPARGQEVPPQGDPVSSSLLKPPPLKDATPPTATNEAAGGQQEPDPIAAAASFLEDLPDPWSIGPVTAAAMAPDLARMIKAQGWDLDAALITKLTEKPGGINRYSPVLRLRIADLPKRPTPRKKPAPLPDWCGECADGARAAEREAHLRLIYDEAGDARPCPKCHPQMTTQAA
jgi:hypothetical protein